MDNGFKVCPKYPRDKWSQSELDFLKENYTKKPTLDIITILSKSRDSILKKASRLGIRKDSRPKLSKEYLINNYHNKTEKEMSDETGYSTTTIAHKLSSLSLLKSKEDLSKIFKRTPKKYSKGVKHYRWKGGKPKSICLICNKKFSGEWGNPNKFCSCKCLAKSKDFSGKKNYFWNGGEQNWKSKKNLYSSNEWIKLRKKIIQEDGGCAICGENNTERLEVHHKKRYKEGGENTRENLITLCKVHHHKIHTLEIFYKNQHSPNEFPRIFQEVLNKHNKSYNQLEFR